MSSPAAKRAAQVATAKAPFWGKWGAHSPKHAEQYLEKAYNRGYGQPLFQSRYAVFEEPCTLLTFFARRWHYDWLKHVAMRVDAQRTPLVVLRRQIWMARLEYWARRFYTRREIKRSAMVEWAFIKERLRQPMTWTMHDLMHFGLWFTNVFCFFALGECYMRMDLYGYPVASPEWAPARPKFVPGFYHVYDPLEAYPFDNQTNDITRQFQRSSWWSNSREVYWNHASIIAGYPHG